MNCQQIRNISCKKDVTEVKRFKKSFRRLLFETPCTLCPEKVINQSHSDNFVNS